MKRDIYIDTLKGMAAISVIFIHTVFWSGDSYVPDYVRIFALFFDVPVFFFLAGSLFANSRGSVSELSKLIVVSSLFAFVIGLIDGNPFSALLSYLVFDYYSAISFFPVFQGSMWFIPVFVVVRLISLLLCDVYETHSFFAYILIFICIIAILFIDLSGYRFLGVGLDYIVVYGTFFNIGYIWFVNKKNVLFLTILVFTFLMLFHFTRSEDLILNLQLFKFPPKPEYFIFSLLSLLLCMFLYGRFYSELLIFFGKNALLFYFCQGVSSSLIYYIVPHLSIYWVLKLLVIFFVNLLISILLVLLIKPVVDRLMDYVYKGVM